MKDAVLVFLSGGVAVALIEVVKELILWSKNRKAKKEDDAMEREDEKERQEAMHINERLETIEKKTDAQSEALKYIMYDRILYLGREYIKKGNITFDERRILNNMHNSYHNGLGGNGDLNTLMHEVNELPLKIIS
jgi:hypothetical protein